jgi:hypothetical protein
MSKYENDLTRMIQAEHSERGRLFRNNVGSVKLDGRYIEYGLCRGSSDLIGWTEIEITPEMVGKKIAIFTAVEVKNLEKDPSPEQEQFIKRVKESGGFAAVIRKTDEIEKIYENK